MSRYSYMTVGAVLVLIIVRHVWSDLTEDCASITALHGCTTDTGPNMPVDGQAIYLQSVDYPGYWWYPRNEFWWDLYVSALHKRELVDAPGQWPKWIWRDCEDGFVCLEAGRYPSNYAFTNYGGHAAYAYSSIPKQKDWARLGYAHTMRMTSEGMYLVLHSKSFYNIKNTIGLKAHLYIPPRCEGWELLVRTDNENYNNSVTQKYEYTRGISKMSSRSQTTSFGIGTNIGPEVSRGIQAASIAGDFSMSWTTETSQTAEESLLIGGENTVPPRKRVNVWQKLATYGLYKWASAHIKICMEDL